MIQAPDWRQVGFVAWVYCSRDVFSLQFMRVAHEGMQAGLAALRARGAYTVSEFYSPQYYSRLTYCSTETGYYFHPKSPEI